MAFEGLEGWGWVDMLGDGDGILTWMEVIKTSCAEAGICCNIFLGQCSMHEIRYLDS